MVDSSQNPDGEPPVDVLKQRHFEEFQQQNDEQQRRNVLRERQPTLFARLSLLENLVELQESRGGEFPPKVVFIHMPDYILNIRRVGKVDVEKLLVALEVYEHNDIVPGILWVPLDHIWWAGTADIPVGAAQVSLRKRSDSAPALPEQYQDARYRLSGLIPKKKGKSLQIDD